MHETRVPATGLVLFSVAALAIGYGTGMLEGMEGAPMMVTGAVGVSVIAASEWLAGKAIGKANDGKE